MRLYLDNRGTVIAIGMESNSRDEIEQQYFSFWNHQATSGELLWVCDTFAYIWVTPKSLYNYLFRSSIMKLLNMDCGRSKGKRKGLMPEAVKMARQRMSEIAPLRFIEDCPKVHEEGHKLGDIDFFTPDLQYIT